MRKNHMSLSVCVGVAACCVFSSCSDGGDFSSSENSFVFDDPSGNFVALTLHDGSIAVDISSAPGYVDAAISCARINNSVGTVAISTSDAVTTSGFDDATAQQVLSNSFYLMNYEISQAQWNLLVRNSGASLDYLSPWSAVNSASAFSSVASDMPASGLSKNAIDVVLSAWNSSHYYKLRLPSGVEWEHACRGGTQAPSVATRFSWGDTFIDNDSAHVAEDGVSDTRITSAGTANAVSVLNMHGNVWEWTSNGNLRGGSWADSILETSSGNILEMDSDIGYALAGVRLIVEAP